MVDNKRSIPSKTYSQPEAIVMPVSAPVG